MYKFLFVVATLVAISVGKPSGKGEYTHKYDDIDVDKILSNDRLLNGHAKCLLGEGPCNPETQALKDIVPEALENECAKCSDDQEKKAEQVLKFIFEQKKDLFSKLEAKYDPEHKYREKYRERAAKEGIKI
ncbi:hypothetical protein Trydic_g4501 [Trypoxylus dichotomus]